MEPQETSRGASHGQRRSDAEIRAIAERLLQEHDAPPPASPQEQLSAQAHGLAPRDEERVSDALAELGAISPDATLRAERAASRDAAWSSSPAIVRDEPGGPDAR